MLRLEIDLFFFQYFYQRSWPLSFTRPAKLHQCFVSQPDHWLLTTGLQEKYTQSMARSRNTKFESHSNLAGYIILDSGSRCHKIFGVDMIDLVLSVGSRPSVKLKIKAWSASAHKQMKQSIVCLQMGTVYK